MSNKIILVTGASRGIGREIAYELAKEGNTVIANYNKSNDMAESLKEIAKNENLNIDTYKADVSSRSEVMEMVNYVLNKFQICNNKKNWCKAPVPTFFNTIYL